MIAKIFIDTFGYYHEIPLKSALDVIYEKYSEDKIFELAINDPDYVSKKKEYSNFLSKIITKAILANEKIDLELYSEDIKKILDNGRTFHVVECDLKMRPIDERYYLPSTAFSFPVGSYTSKFSKINQETAEDKALYEIDYILEYASDIGLSYRNNDTQMKIINLNNINKFREEITLDDIKIGCDQSGIYLKDEVSSQKIIPIYRNLADLNYRREHFLARFLVLFGKYKYLPPINFNIENYLSFIFIPQIMNGRVIVSKAMWNIKNNYKEKGDLVNIIREYQLKYRLPNIVAILEKGEEYPVFLNTELGISILHKYLRKNTYVTLVEYLELESKSKYIKEYIFNIKCKGIQYDTSLSPCIQTNQKIISNKYISWVIILKQNTNKILKYLDWFCQENNIAFFFVRYNDHNSKSLRFRTRNSLDQNRFIQEVLDNLRIEGEISYYYISDYTPEYNRYGEGDLIDRAEGIFEADSNLAIKLIQYTEKNEFDFGVYIIIDTIFFGMEDLTEGFRLFEKNCIDSEKTKSIRDSYKKNRKYFLELFNRINRKIETSHPEIKTIRLNIKIYFTELKKQYCDEIFWYMVKSFMHMRLNRYIGVKTYENDLLFISKYIIKNMYNTQKFKRGKVDEG